MTHTPPRVRALARAGTAAFVAGLLASVASVVLCAWGTVDIGVVAASVGVPVAVVGFLTAAVHEKPDPDMDRATYQAYFWAVAVSGTVALSYHVLRGRDWSPFYDPGHYNPPFWLWALVAVGLGLAGGAAGWAFGPPMGYCVAARRLWYRGRYVAATGVGALALVLVALEVMFIMTLVGLWHLPAILRGR